jgi:hypothetical protein
MEEWLMRKWMAVLLVLVLVFAMAAPALAAAKMKGKPVFVQHPYTAKQTYKVNADIKTWGYVAPKASDLTSRTIEILVYKRTGPAKYELVKTVDGTLLNKVGVRHKTLFNAMFSLDMAGRYRMRARYGWKGADGTMKYKLGGYKYFRVK